MLPCSCKSLLSEWPPPPGSSLSFGEARSAALASRALPAAKSPLCEQACSERNAKQHSSIEVEKLSVRRREMREVQGEERA